MTMFVVVFVLLVPFTQITKADFQLQTFPTGNTYQFQLSENQNEHTYSNLNGNIPTYTSSTNAKIPYHIKNKHLLNPDQYTNAFKSNPNNQNNKFQQQQYKSTETGSIQQSLRQTNPIYNFGETEIQNEEQHIVNRFPYAQTDHIQPALSPFNGIHNYVKSSNTYSNTPSPGSDTQNDFHQYQYPTHWGKGPFVEIGLDLNNGNGGIINYNNDDNGPHLQQNIQAQNLNTNRNNNNSPKPLFEEQYRNSKHLNPNFFAVEPHQSNLISSNYNINFKVEANRNRHQYSNQIPDFKIIPSESIPVTFKNIEQENYNSNSNSNNYYNNYNAPVPEITVQPSTSLNIPVHIMDDTRSQSHSKIEQVPISNPQQIQQLQNQRENVNRPTAYSTLTSLLPPLRYEDQTTKIEYYPVQNSYHDQQNLGFTQNYNNNNNVGPNFKYPTLIIKKDKKDFDFAGLLTNDQFGAGTSESTSTSYSLKTEGNKHNHQHSPSQNGNQNSNINKIVNPAKIDNYFLPPVPDLIQNGNVPTNLPLASALSTFSGSDYEKTGQFNNPIQTNNNFQVSYVPSVAFPPQTLTGTSTVHTVSNPLSNYLNYDFQLKQNSAQNFKVALDQGNGNSQSHGSLQPQSILSGLSKFNHPVFTDFIPAVTTSSATSVIYSTPVPVAVQPQETNIHQISSPIQPHQNLPIFFAHPNPQLNYGSSNQNDFQYEGKPTNQNENENSTFSITPSIQLQLLPPLPPPSFSALQPGGATKSHYNNSKPSPPQLTTKTEQITSSSSFSEISDNENNIPIIYGTKFPENKTQLNSAHAQTGNIHHHHHDHFPGIKILATSASHLAQATPHHQHQLLSSNVIMPGLGKRRRRQRPRNSVETDNKHVNVKEIDGTKLKIRNNQTDAQGSGKPRRIPLRSIFKLHKNRLTKVRSILRHSMHDWPLANKLHAMARQFHRSPRHFYQTMGVGYQGERFQRILTRHHPLHTNSKQKVKKSKPDGNGVKLPRRI